MTDDPNRPVPSTAEEPLPLEEQVKKLEDDLKKLAAEKDDLRDQLLRRQADFENFRKRIEREQKEARQTAEADLVASLLPVLDAFERALAAPGARAASDGAEDEYRKGVELIYKQLLDALTRAGLKPIEAAGKLFDPFYHHALERVETCEQPDHTVLADLQRGYTFRQRVLRPAEVRVAVKPGGAAH